MQKRTFLRLSMLVPSTALLSACSTTEMRRIILEDKTQVQPGSPSAYTDADRSASRQAREIFSSPRFANSDVVQQPLLTAYRNFMATMKTYEPLRDHGIRDIPLQDAAPAALASADVMREYARLTEQPERRSSPTTTAIKGTTVVTVPPRTSVQFIKSGYCMDSTLPLPSTGEKYILRPASSMIPPELMPLYKALHEYALVEPRARRGLQAMIWALRDAGTRSVYADKIRPPYLQLMGAAMPGGDRVFLDYHRQTLAKNTNALGDLIRRVTSVRGNDGRTHNISDLVKSWDQAQDDDLNAAEAHTANAIGHLASLPMNAPIPSDDSDYSMIAPGVAANAVGTGPLTPKITIANNTDQPFVFDTKDYVAESQRPVQRVGLGAPTQVTQGGSGISNSATLRQVAYDVQMALRDFTLNTVHLWARYFLDSKGLSVIAPLVNGAPVLGSLLQLSNLIRGKDWLTGEELGCAQQVLAAIGTIPGAGMFTQMVGVGRTGAIAALTQSAYLERIVSAAQRTQLSGDIGLWLTSQGFAGPNAMLPSNEIGSSISQILTGGCRRSWSI